MLVVDELRAHRQDRFGRAKDLGFQNLVAVQGLFAGLLRQAVVAVLPAEDEVAAAIQANHEPALDAGGVQDPHADQPVHHLGTHRGDRIGADQGQVIIQSVIARKAVLLGLGQPIEVVQDGRPLFAILEVELASAAELADEEQHAVPEKEAAVVGDPLRAARVSNLVEPGVELREKMADGASEDGADGQGRPAWRRWWRL